jgi:hypothetical protein
MATKEEMDVAAEKAAEKLDSLVKDPQLGPGIKALSSWWKDNYMTAGHRRLGRKLLKVQ